MTLDEVYKEAGVSPSPPWADQIHLVHPYTGEPLVPRDTQLTGLWECMSQDNHRFGLYDTMGAGKSLISYLYSIWHASAGNSVLVVMPPKLMNQYRNNLFGTFRGIGAFLTCEVYHGTPAKRAALKEAWINGNRPDIIITSFEMFRRDPFLFAISFWRKVIVADEAKFLSNPENTTSQALDRFMGAEGDKAAVIMNGTPARNDLTNLYGYIRFTSPEAYPTFKNFQRRHVLYDSFQVPMKDKKGRVVNRRVNKIKAYKNQDELYKNLYKRGRRIDLPPPTGVEMLYKEFDLSDKHMSKYKEMVENKMLEFEDGSILDLTAASGVRHLCMQAVFDPSRLQVDEEGAVLETVKEMLEEVDFTQTKVLLAAYYQNTVETLTKALDSYGARALYGKVTGKKAEEAKQAFLTDPDCKVLVINYESGGVGLDGLQNVCHVGIAVEPGSIPGDFAQTVARLARPGQKNGVRFFNLIARGTIYSRTVKDRTKKANAIDQVVVEHTNVSKEDLRRELLDC